MIRRLIAAVLCLVLLDVEVACRPLALAPAATTVPLSLPAGRG